MRPIPLLLVLALALSGCEGWPLYLNLPNPVLPDPEAQLLDVVEDGSLAEGEVQDLGALAVPAQIRIVGAVDGCGYDDAADGPAWPLLPADADGDGVVDGDRPRHNGWYTSDVDEFGLSLDTAGWIEATLAWDNAPEGENLPVDPADPEGPWSTESDLDLLVLGADGVLQDEAVSLAYPEDSGPSLRIEAGEAVSVAVACHHGLPTAWSLSIDLVQP